MTPRTEHILEAVKSASRRESDSEQVEIPKSANATPSVKELTSVTVYMCALIECYKIDERSTCVHASDWVATHWDLIHRIF